MKKQFICMLLLFFSINALSQQTTTPEPTIKTDYLKKSKNQKTAAWILLGGGFALTSAGIIIGINGTAEEIIGAFTNEKSNTFEIGAGLFYTGLAAMVGSIPLFIASSKNKKKGTAITAAFKYENRKSIQQNSVVRVIYPAVSIKIGL